MKHTIEDTSTLMTEAAGSSFDTTLCENP